MNTGTDRENRVTAPPLSDIHRAYLNEHAITDEVIREAGIHSSGDEIMFPWVDRAAGQGTYQSRRWPEPPEGLIAKYRWGAGQTGLPLHFAAWRVPDATGPAIISEGTKQSLAVASWAPPEYSVYGMSGCWNWRNKGETGTRLHKLDRFAGRKVIVILDADAGSNLDVYEAGEALAAELAMEDAAEVAFVQLPAQGKEGIDDYLAGIDPRRRQERLAKLIAAATARPAASKPKTRKVTETPPDTGGLPLLVVNGDRLAVIRQAVAAMQARWARHQLFSYGGVMTRLRGTRTEPLDKDAFANWLAETVAMYRYKPPGPASPGSYEASWPDPVTLGAILSRGGDPEQFPELTRVSRTPFAREDGSICAKNGYDEATRTMLVMGNSGMDRLQIPEDPGPAEAAVAASFLMDEWLGDLSFRDDASRANALALVLTPFIRGLVPLVPLAVISGLQMGVGKNLMADCISRLIAGDDLAPLPWMPDDDEENAKKIHAAFRDSTSLMCFDEAHVIGGASLTRAITSTTFTDRILGVSKMASYPNKVTWMALGNQVAVLADMSRRSYFIELYPEGANPQDRDESSFRHPDLRTWTTDNRPELVTAALVIIRAWFAAGQPPRPRGSLMGSFERWDKMMSGMLGYAGVSGFLANLAEKRTERDITGGFWTEHLAWLRGRFNSGPFTSLDVKSAAMASGGTWEAPPRLEDPASITFVRDLGVEYSRIQDRWFGPFRIVRGDKFSHRKVATWYVEQGPGGTGGTPSPGSPGQPEIPTGPLGGPGGIGGTMQAGATGAAANPVVPGHTPLAKTIGGLQGEHTLPELGELQDPQTGNDQAHPSRPAETPAGEGIGGTGGTLTPPALRAQARTRAHARTHTRGVGVPAGPPGPSSGPAIGFDLETADADDIFRAERGYRAEDGAGFVRLAGITGPSGAREIVTVRDLLAVMGAAGTLDGHNIMGFDGIALAHHEGMDWKQFAAKARDSELIARQVNPPRSRESGSSEDKYDLDHVAAGLGLPGKTDDLARLARQHGGYGKIPLDDPEYRSYLLGDLAATNAVSARLAPYYAADPYLPREHRLAAIAGQMTLTGLHVDRELLDRRRTETDGQKAQALQLLHDGWGLPLTRTVLKGRGAARGPVEEPVDAPLATDAGREWLGTMWERYGVPDPPRTDTGKLALGSDALAPLARDPACPGEMRSMLALMDIVTGSRTVYQTATDWLCPDGRVHPKISMRQASGRWSFTKPGLTVYGKHAGRHVERDIFLPDPGHVLVSFDLAQVDMRGIAALCQDPEYMQLFLPGRDAHQEIADQLGIARQDAKARGHGWNYGLGPARMIREGADPEVVYRFVNGMEARFPRLCAWREGIRAQAKAGEILDNGFGRRMRADPPRAYTVAPALMGQGSARDIMGECLLRLPEWTWPMLRAMVHDEIVLSVPVADLAEVVIAVTAAMTWTWTPPGASQGVPILCDINGPGLSWGAISGKCPDCGKGTHGKGFCDIAASLKKIAARHELDTAA